ncbi:hypothetical protein ACET3Z_007036 [Daucus carota]
MVHSKTDWECKSTYKVSTNSHGINLVALSNEGGSTLVTVERGHVTSWRNKQGDELLFTSTKIPRPPSAARGGIPVCFPQFGPSASLEANGQARNEGWKIDNDPPPLIHKDCRGKSYVDLLRKPSKEELRRWPHSYEFRLRVLLAYDGNLNMISRIRNIDSKPFSFSFGYHTYLSVSDISEVRIEGLETLDYLDNLSDRKRFTEHGDAVTFESEVDRAYLCTPSCIAVVDHGKKRTVVIKKEGLPDAVVWNPWERKSKTMADFGKVDYRKMVCVDGAVIERPIALKPGEEWTGCLELEHVPSSFCSDKYDSRLKHF